MNFDGFPDWRFKKAMTKIAVIGANSYIARNLICSLKEKQDISLTLCDWQEESKDGEEPYRQIRILEPESLHELDLSADIIYMFVGKTGSADGFDDPKTFIDINEMALLNLLNEYRLQNAKGKIIFPSTRLVYSGKKGAQKEDAEKEAKTIYAANKLACERYLRMYHNVYGIRYAIVRICIPYGTLVPNASSYGTAEFMLKKATAGEDISLYGDGSVRRTLTYMGDICEQLYRVGISDEAVNDVYNLGGEDYSLLEMAKLIAEKYHVSITFRPYPEIAEKIESGDTVFDGSKLETLLGGYTYSRFSDWISRQS